MKKPNNCFPWLLAISVIALSGCFPQVPEFYKCTNKKPGCPSGEKCDFDNEKCVPEDTKLDGRVDGTVADAGKDMAPDQKPGKDQTVDQPKADKKVTLDKGMDLPKTDKKVTLDKSNRSACPACSSPPSP